MGTSKLTLYLQFVGFLIFTAALASTAFLFFPDIKAAGVAPVLAIAFASSIAQVGAAVYFVAGFHNFKPALKRAYAFLSVGILLFSLSQLVPSLSVFTDILSRNSVVTSAFIVAPYFAGAMGMYWGVRTFARSLDVQSVWNTLLYAFLCALVLAAIVAFLPHPELPVSANTYKLLFAPIGWSLALSAVSCMLALRVRKVIGAMYKPAMLWLIFALVALGFTAAHEFTTKVYFTYSGYAQSSFSVWPFLVVAILFLRTGIGFYAAGRGSLRLPANASFVDVVVAVSMLVSKPKDVDEIMDDVRMVTASHHDTANLSAQDKTTLANVYLKLERYLTTSERLHTYRAEDLRATLPADFLQALGHPQTTTDSSAAAPIATSL